MPSPHKALLSLCVLWISIIVNSSTQRWRLINRDFKAAKHVQLKIYLNEWRTFWIVYPQLSSVVNFSVYSLAWLDYLNCWGYDLGENFIICLKLRILNYFRLLIWCYEIFTLTFMFSVRIKSFVVFCTFALLDCLAEFNIGHCVIAGDAFAAWTSRYSRSLWRTTCWNLGGSVIKRKKIRDWIRYELFWITSILSEEVSSCAFEIPHHLCERQSTDYNKAGPICHWHSIIVQCSKRPTQIIISAQIVIWPVVWPPKDFSEGVPSTEDTVQGNNGSSAKCKAWLLQPELERPLLLWELSSLLWIFLLLSWYLFPWTAQAARQTPSVQSPIAFHLQQETLTTFSVCCRRCYLCCCCCYCYHHCWCEEVSDAVRADVQQTTRRRKGTLV